MSLISIVVPCFNEQESINIFFEKTLDVLKKIDCDFEILFVDDGSTDDTLNIVKDLARKDSSVRFISFSRNFGKESAIFAGLEKSIGDYVAIMDVDLQDPPELLLEMYNKIKHNNCDCIAAKRTTRKNEPIIRSFFSRKFYFLFNKISKTKIYEGARDYRLMTKKMVKCIIALREYNRFSKGIFSWVGFKTDWIEYKNIKRYAGKTSWSFFGLCRYAIDGIINFSTVPLVMASYIGFFMFIFSFFWICTIIFKTLIFGEPVLGYPSLMCIIVFIGGIQLFCMGILGQYISKIYLEAKKRPIYIIQEEG